MANKTSSRETEGGAGGGSASGYGRQVTRKTTYRPTNNKVTPSLPSYLGHSSHANEEAKRQNLPMRQEILSEKRPCLVSVEVTPKYNMPLPGT